MHAVAQSAANELHSKKEDSMDAATQEEMAHRERLHEADELSEQAIELDHMNFSAKDLNSFSALADQKANEHYKPPVHVEVKAVEAPHQKSFFEQIYD